MIGQVIAALEAAGFDRVYPTGDVPGEKVFPYLHVYPLIPYAERSMARTEAARQFRFGVTCVDLGSRHLEADADKVEATFEGSRILHAASRIEWVSRGPLQRDPEVTEDGQEIHTLPIHFTTTIPRGTA